MSLVNDDESILSIDACVESTLDRMEYDCMDYEKYKFIKNEIESLFHIESILLSNGEKVQFDEGRITYKLDILINVLKMQNIVFDKMQLVLVCENIYFGIIPYQDNQACILGPMGGSLLSNKQIWDYCIRFHVHNKECFVPKFSFFKLKNILNITSFMLTGTIPEESGIPVLEKGMDEQEAYDVIKYQMHNEQEEKERYVYQFEEQFFKMIENGETEKIAQIIADKDKAYRDDALQRVGILAKESDFKQMEYMTVTSIALASRAAIRGKARSDVCYDLSDLFLQKLSVAKNVTEIFEISSQVLYRFAKEVENEQKVRSENALVENCKNYILKHLCGKFTVEQMAEDLTVSRTYLAKIFKEETGFSIQDYIWEHRVRAAANLLKYSNEKIGEIAYYMQFSSSSRFSQMFKRYYDMTPEAYRRKNKTMDFMEQ